jgi:DNA ligase-1
VNVENYLIKAMLADDYVREKLVFPRIVQPKIDGVRGVNLIRRFSGRSLKPFGNRYITSFFSQEQFRGFDGELAAEAETHPRLCSLTTSATSTIEGTPWLMWHIFDYVTKETLDVPYAARLGNAEAAVARMQSEHPLLGCHLKVIPWTMAYSLPELDALVETHIDMGYEGTIVRDPNGRYKQGRSTAREGGLLRIKPYIEVDAIVQRIVEGRRNDNEARINPLGHTERSTHQENMQPNGMVGAMESVLCEDVIFNGNTIHRKGDPIRVSAGRLTHEQRALFFIRQDLLVGKRIKAQIFPIGIKDKPRHPTFQSFRSDEDTVER